MWNKKINFQFIKGVSGVSFYLLKLRRLLSFIIFLSIWYG